MTFKNVDNVVQWVVDGYIKIELLINHQMNLIDHIFEHYKRKFQVFQLYVDLST